MPESPFLFSSVVPACGFCLKVQSRSQRVEELGSQPSTRSFGLQLGETVGHSWTSRLVDFPAPELSERTGGTTRRNTKYYERSQYVFDNTGSTLATKLKRTQNGANFERQMHRLNSNGELSRSDASEREGCAPKCGRAQKRSGLEIPEPREKNTKIIRTKPVCY